MLLLVALVGGKAVHSVAKVEQVLVYDQACVGACTNPSQVVQCLLISRLNSIYRLTYICFDLLPIMLFLSLAAKNLPRLK